VKGEPIRPKKGVSIPLTQDSCEVQVIALRLTKCIVNRLMRLNMKTKIAIFLVAAAVMSSLASAESYEERLTDSTAVLREMSHASDKGIPQDLLGKARCVVVVPGLKKVAFIGGGKYGRGYASCMTRKGWSPPAAVRIEGGSFGLQLGGSSTDVIMLVLNEGGMKKLLSDKFTLGGEAAAAAGPVGRNTSANTDVLMKAEILSWSRSQGVFAGLSLEGATLRQDQDENAKLYGKPLTNEEILTGSVKRPATAATFLAQLQRFSGKGTPPAVVAAKSQQRQPVQNNPSETASVSARDSSSQTDSDADNTVNNKPAHAGSGTTADQQKNGNSDLQLTASIRQSIVADSSLSTYAHNVKIVVENGEATLKGPVRTQEEKSTVAAKAATIVGQDHVVDEMSVVP
jgi:lipid-binding SYLF domain-containing protein/osmotically-inducible protein OsmY